MPKLALQVQKSPATLRPDESRVIARPFMPGGPERIKAILSRIDQLTDEEVEAKWQEVHDKYAHRHVDFEAICFRHWNDAIAQVGKQDVEPNRMLLVGSYLTMEYSLESAALFNPSIVPHPVQGGDGTRVIISLRACGEGHVSSIEFREGVIEDNGDIKIDEPTPYAITERPKKHHGIDKNVFYLKIKEMGAYDTGVDRVLNLLPAVFTIEELQIVFDTLHWTDPGAERHKQLVESMMWLARSSYGLEFPPESAVSERVIFPVTENESRGIEDARFVRFTEDDGKCHYYATYTAYNGFRILPQMLETSDFRTFRIHTINGSCVQNKGLALFPRKIDEHYMMLARSDGENIFMLRTDHLFFWNESEQICQPTYPWEFVQIGNCGSPIELEQGWLVLTHGVGPMREYAMGAMLLDLNDPSKITAVLDQPLLSPDPKEREGYVPNVVYSCGAMLHNGQLIIPYAAADSYSRIATVDVNDVLECMVTPRNPN